MGLQLMQRIILDKMAQSLYISRKQRLNLLYLDHVGLEYCHYIGLEFEEKECEYCIVIF
jgi:hypothetical protein